MTAVAIFVEGQTELIFVERLLFEILGYQDLRIVREQQHGDIFHEIGVRGAPPENAEHLVLLSNCSCDGKVLPAIEERAPLLRNENFDRVIGLRDIYPIPTAELEEIHEEINGRLANMPLPCEIFIAIREIEAWFLADTGHFSRFRAALTPQSIQEGLGVNLENQDIERINHPSGQLDSIYALVGESYDKKIGQSHAIVNVLDYEYLFLEGRARVPAFGRFVDALSEAF